MTESTDPRPIVPAEPTQPIPPAEPPAPVWAPQPVLEPVSAAAPPIAAVPSRRRGGGGGTAFLVVGAIVLAGGLGFAAGRVTAPASAASVAGRSGLGTGTSPFASAIPGQDGTTVGPLPSGAAGDFRPGGFIGAGSGMTVEGTVSAVTAETITLDVNGTSTAVQTDSSTTYHSQAAATAADVTVGKKVLVRMSGFGGRAVVGGQGGPGASSAPGAAGGTGAPVAGTPTLTATDVTIAAQ
jgi:hypothetical protein